MPTPSPSKDMREAFHTHLRIEYGQHITLAADWSPQQRPDGTYEDHQFQREWEQWRASWLAASALAEKRIVDLLRTELQKRLAAGMYPAARTISGLIDRIEKGQL